MQVFNNLSRRLEDFVPLAAPLVTIYSCGPTVYDHSHIGHARSAISWDLLYRYLVHLGYTVRWARNITNVDDKIVKRASELGLSPDKLSREFTYEFWKDMRALNVSWPDLEPRATDYIPAMIRYIEDLLSQGFAYISHGDVYFRVSHYAHYGQLKGLSLEQLSEGLARIEDNTHKENKLDFALWKSFATEEFAFDSPWGRGRPGWHLECSTMIEELFNQNHNTEALIDIHAGGDDLLFPHHENECAQSHCHSHKPLAKYWLHNGMVMINGSKMSKSENNFLSIKDALALYKANTIRYFCLSTHYKKQINFTHEALRAAETGLDKLFAQIYSKLGTELSDLKSQAQPEILRDFETVMNKDLNSPQALALIFECSKTPTTLASAAYLLEILGFQLQPETTPSKQNSQALEAAMRLILDLRADARERRDFATSDKIRDQLALANISIKDSRDQASIWEINS